MPDAAPVTESAAPDTSTVNYSKPSQAPVTPPPFAPANPLAVADKNMQSRHARLQNLMKDLGEAEEKRTNAKIRGEDPDKVEDEPSEADAGAKVAEETESSTAEAGADPDRKVLKAEKTEEQRLQERRDKVEADEKAKAKADAGEEPDAAEPEKDTPEAKAKEEATKAEKDRKERFQKVLALEAKAQKERDRLRGIEGRLVQREKELEQNISRAREQYQRAIQANANEVRMAKQIMQLAQDNPLALLEQAGATPEDVASWVAKASDPHTTEINKMRRELQERDRREQEYQRQAQQQRAEAQRQQQMKAVEQEYLSSFDEKDDKGEPTFEPALIVFSERERIRLGHELADEAHAKGYSFTHRDIAEAVNALAMEDDRYKKIQSRLSSVAKPAAPSTADTQSTSQKPAAAAVQAKPAAKTTVVATNSVAQQASAEKAAKPDPDYKRRREQRNRRLFSGLDE